MLRALERVQGGERELFVFDEVSSVDFSPFFLFLFAEEREVLENEQARSDGREKEAAQGPTSRECCERGEGGLVARVCRIVLFSEPIAKPFAKRGCFRLAIFSVARAGGC